nr:hypothetical protein [Deltaproteobacteria bacterium]
MSDPARPRSSARADIWNIPNALTMSRVAMIPVVLYYVTAGTPRTPSSPAGSTAPPP